jgi:Holliday junction resolvase RusA-like endonuclease
MANIEFFIPGIPKPKARARTVRNKHTGGVHSYTPETSATWESIVYARSLDYKPDKPIDCPLSVYLHFWLPRPKSPKNKLHPVTRPDLDNLAKSVFDALNGVFWVDDSRIVLKGLRKAYATEGGPGVAVIIEEMEG